MYSGHSLLCNLRTILADFAPDTVVAPHPNDSHVDHWATGAFVALAIAGSDQVPRPRLWLYLVHRGDFPLPRGYLPFAPLLPPLRLVNDTLVWGIVPLDSGHVEQKGVAMEQYRSQLTLVGNFLRSFVRQNELFCELSSPPVRRLMPGQPITPLPEQWETMLGVPVTPLIVDSAGDTALQEVGPSGDFVALYAARTEDELWIAAELRGAANRLFSYGCSIRAANGEEIFAHQVLYAASLRSRPTEQTAGRFMLARFSLQDLGYPSAAVVTCEARYPSGKLIDRIGWAIADFAE